MTTRHRAHDMRRVLEVRGEERDYLLRRCAGCGRSRLEWRDDPDASWSDAPDGERAAVLAEVRDLLGSEPLP